LSYFGGPIISNVQVVQVLYGSGSYNSQVAGTTSPSMGKFFGDITGSGSGLISLLTQYNTTISGGTNQTFGFGSFGGLFQIVPSAANNGSTISDSQIQSELLAQISGGHLPAPVLDAAGNPNTLYMIYFPPGKPSRRAGHQAAWPGASALITEPHRACSADTMFCTACCRICRRVAGARQDAAPRQPSATTHPLPATNWWKP
jgi:hypothetical protein